MSVAINRIAEWLADVRLSLQLGQDEVDRRTRALGARVSQSYLSQLERGVKPLSELGGARMDALRRVYQISPEEWARRTGLAIVTPTDSSTAKLPVESSIPDSLAEAVRAYGINNQPLTTVKWQRFLASMHFTGKRPETARDWYNLYHDLERHGVDPQ